MMSYVRSDVINLDDFVRSAEGDCKRDYVVSWYNLSGGTDVKKGMEIPKMRLEYKLEEESVGSLEGVARKVVKVVEKDINGHVYLFASRGKKGDGPPSCDDAPVIITSFSSVNTFGNHDDSSDVLKIAGEIAKGILEIKG